MSNDIRTDPEVKRGTVEPHSGGSRRMKDLLESKNLLSEPEVVEAYWGLIGRPTDHVYINDICIWCHKGKDFKPGSICNPRRNEPRPIPGSLADVAEEMQQAIVKLDEEEYYCCFLEVYGESPKDTIDWDPAREESWMAIKAEPKHRIIAAVLAWRAGK